MCSICTQECHMQHLGQADIVDITRESGEKSDVFETLNTRYVIVPNPYGDESEVGTGSDVAVTFAVLQSKIPASKLV